MDSLTWSMLDENSSEKDWMDGWMVGWKQALCLLNNIDEKLNIMLKVKGQEV